MTGTPEQRFDAKVMPEPNSGCWLWVGAWITREYGIFSVRPKTFRVAHVWNYERYRGPIPSGLELDHLCRVHQCVNPWHLEAVTHLENVRRGLALGPKQTHCKRGHLITRVGNRRGCSVCHRANCARARMRQRAKRAA